MNRLISQKELCLDCQVHIIIVDLSHYETLIEFIVCCRMTTPDGAQLVVGDVEWLDGLGVHLPGPATSPPTAHIETSNCDESASVNAQGLVGHGMESEVSERYMNARLQCHNENISLSQNLVSCSTEKEHESEELGDHQCDNDENEVDQMCVDVPCCAHSNEQTTSSAAMQCECASDECKCLVMDSSSGCISQQQEKPSFLVLAAGLLSEPGRLFTLWWALSKHTHKCKKE